MYSELVSVQLAAIRWPHVARGGWVESGSRGIALDLFQDLILSQGRRFTLFYHRLSVRWGSYWNARSWSRGSQSPRVNIFLNTEVQGGWIFLPWIFSPCVGFICHQNPVWNLVGFFCHSDFGGKFFTRTSQLIQKHGKYHLFPRFLRTSN